MSKKRRQASDKPKKTVGGPSAPRPVDARVEKRASVKLEGESSQPVRGASAAGPRLAIASRVMALKAKAGGWEKLVDALGGTSQITRATLGRYATKSTKNWGGLPPPERIYHLALGEARLEHGDNVAIEQAVGIAKEWMHAAGYSVDSAALIEERLRHWSGIIDGARNLDDPERRQRDLARFERLDLAEMLRVIIRKSADNEQAFQAFAELDITERYVRRIAEALLSQPDSVTLKRPEPAAHHVVIRPLIWSSDLEVLNRRVDELALKVADQPVKDYWKEILVHHRLSLLFPLLDVKGSAATKAKAASAVQKRIASALEGVMGNYRVDAKPCDRTTITKKPYYLLVPDNRADMDLAWRMEENSDVREALKAIEGLPRWTWSTLCVETEKEEIDELLERFLPSVFMFSYNRLGAERLRWPSSCSGESGSS